MLLSSLAAEKIERSYWLVGLDDAITQPGAIELLSQEAGAELRVATHHAVGFRFHPKVFQFGFDSNVRKSFLVVGSNNLTSAAMRGNAEAFVAMRLSSRSEARSARLFWNQLWEQGHPPTDIELKNYSAKYHKAKQARDSLEKILKTKTDEDHVREILASDEAELDPALAETCWIECGAVTAMGRELEFKAEQGMFFNLNPSGETARVFEFRVSNGKIVNLRMKYQQNHMWRLQMNNDVPEVRVGLRPHMSDGSLGRSPFVAVFTRTDKVDTYNLRFVDLSSTAFKNLRDKSIRHGTIGHTSARQYGWC